MWNATRRFRILAVGAAVAVSMAGCGGDDDGAPPAAAVTPQVTASAACAGLAGRTLGGATIGAAVVVPASGNVPLYCKVSALITPKLNLELRLPDAWNGKLHYEGGGGYNGAIPPVADQALNALKQGYATVSSDSGHQASALDASFALDDPVAAQLFGSLSVPTVASSAVVMLKQAYGSGPTRMYFEGCSNGGREALMNAERYPNLFDGIIARAPAYNWVGIMGAFNRTAKAQVAPGGTFSSAKLATLAKGVRDACDASDGITDGLVSNPVSCAFDPMTLRCSGGGDTADTCLSDAQIAVVTSWTTPAVFAGGVYRNAGWYLTGSEDDAGAWPAWVTGGSNGVHGALQYLFSDTTVKNYLARDPSVESLTYTPYDQNPNALFSLSALNDATNTDLRPFLGRNGKLILWHGSNDSALSYKSTAEYYAGVTTAVGGQATADSFMRFYVAPGVDHCAGGPGADDVDLLKPLDAWVTQNTAPADLVSNKIVANATTFSRPLCRYPQYPRYTGPANDTAAAKLASSYVCTSPG